MSAAALQPSAQVPGPGFARMRALHARNQLASLVWEARRAEAIELEKRATVAMMSLERAQDGTDRLAFEEAVHHLVKLKWAQEAMPPVLRNATSRALDAAFEWAAVVQAGWVEADLQGRR